MPERHVDEHISVLKPRKFLVLFCFLFSQDLNYPATIPAGDASLLTKCRTILKNPLWRAVLALSDPKPRGRNLTIWIEIQCFPDECREDGRKERGEALRQLTSYRIYKCIIAREDEIDFAQPPNF